jgi:hypothetical protein
MELLTILGLASLSGTTDPNGFPDVAADAWTSSLWKGYGLYVDFNSDNLLSCGDDSHLARCVRGSRCYPKSRFVVLDGGLVRDTLTGLVWQQQGSTTQMTWADAQSYCSSLGSGFRLPTFKEWDSLDLTSPSGASIDTTAFPSGGRGRSWTSSPSGGWWSGVVSGYVRCGDFSTSASNYCDGDGGDWAMVSDSLNVRCVR